MLLSRISFKRVIRGGAATLRHPTRSRRWLVGCSILSTRGQLDGHPAPSHEPPGPTGSGSRRTPGRRHHRQCLARAALFAISCSPAWSPCRASTRGGEVTGRARGAASGTSLALIKPVLACHPLLDDLHLRDFNTCSLTRGGPSHHALFATSLPVASGRNSARRGDLTVHLSALALSSSSSSLHPKE